MDHWWNGDLQEKTEFLGGKPTPAMPGPPHNSQSRDSSVDISTRLRAGKLGFWVRFQVGAGNFSFHHRVQNDSGSHPASFPMGTRGSFPGSKAARA
jgi:hypothetical protein